MKQMSLRLLGSLGIVIFVPLFLVTFANPQSIERSGRSFIEWKLQSESDKAIDSIQLPAPTKLEALLGNKAKELRQEIEGNLARVKQQLKADAPAILAGQLAKLRNLDCECRKRREKELRSNMQIEVASLEKAKAKLVDFSHSKYMDIVKQLTLDVRIFLSTNAVIFTFLLLASFMRPLAVKHLFLPGGLMLISTIICSYFYLFEQNWFYTVIYNDHTGFGFVAYLIFVFSILCDIVFNRARITTEILNACLQAIGKAASFSPC